MHAARATQIRLAYTLKDDNDKMLSRSPSLPLLQLLLTLHLIDHSSTANPLPSPQGPQGGRTRTFLNTAWKFHRWATNPDGIIYDYRPDLENLTNIQQVLKPWILPSANAFIADAADRYERPEDDPVIDVPYLTASFDDAGWETVDLPHDWAIAGPFNTDPEWPYSGMGRLPSEGVGWYRRSLQVTDAELELSTFLKFDGAMSYTMVWVNERLVGGWPYGYNSFRLEISDFLHAGENVVAVRLDNPQDSARWYPGGGLYRNVWLEQVGKTRVAQFGTFVTTRTVSEETATVDLQVIIENAGEGESEVEVVTTVHVGTADGANVAESPPQALTIAGGATHSLNQSITIPDPLLWGPVPLQTPNVYIASTTLYTNGQILDTYTTQFGIRTITYDPNAGILINNQYIPVYGVNNHHDLGALGAAFNLRAAERQLEILQELGCNALRTAHNPPAPELLDLTDRMGFVVLDEIFDSWEFNKTDNDFHLIFPDWHEADLRAFIRRDRNHPSIVAWSYGNEVREQVTNETGAVLSSRLKQILHEEDPYRKATSSIASVTPEWPFPHTLDIISLNYRGAGVRDLNTFSGVNGTEIPPEYPVYHAAIPDKMIWSTESASTLSSRGSYLFPVIDTSLGAPVNDSSGGDEAGLIVSDTGLYAADYGQSPDRSFLEQDRNPYVAGEFVWTGWDYIGEPTPYETARSSYSGIIDLAGFRKDRFFQYQARWRPELAMVHLQPHWNWAGREGEVTPVHCFTSGDQAELFVNGQSQGRKTQGEFEYRIRWDEVIYQPGEIHVVAYKAGQEWATATRHTTGEVVGLRMTADREAIAYDGLDLSFLTVELTDARGDVVPTANNTISFSASEPGVIAGTDNGFQGDFNPFPSTDRNAFNGLALAIVKAEAGSEGSIIVSAVADGLQGAEVTLSAIA